MVTNYPIVDKDTVNAAIHCSTKTSLFDIQYEAWTKRDKAQKTRPNFENNWSEKICLKPITTQAAETYGWGRKAQQQTPVRIDHKYEATMGKFANAHNSSQATIAAHQQQYTK